MVLLGIPDRDALHSLDAPYILVGQLYPKAPFGLFILGGLALLLFGAYGNYWLHTLGGLAPFFSKNLLFTLGGLALLYFLVHGFSPLRYFLPIW